MEGDWGGGEIPKAKDPRKNFLTKSQRKSVFWNWYKRTEDIIR